MWGSSRVMESEVLNEIAKAKGKSVAQVCLRWEYEQGIAIVIKSYNKERMKQNLEIFDGALSEEESKKISEISQSRRVTGEEFISATGPYKTLEWVDLRWVWFDGKKRSVHNFPRTLEALILHLLSPVGAEVLTQKFDEMDQRTAEEDRIKFYQVFYGAFDDQFAAMDAILSGKEAFAFQAFKNVLDQYLGISFDGPKPSV
ncbi:hypothetical protein TEA_019985 [Camellia sinensis var. sinensis]|uniref:NADP-dependent oxidoreductase domain-containing protein n=1 Tax=Camellia sinensis var. sinensis TaxID=542762 RepID=A0A4S4DT09_CAMSN|nr:hypothetical protein TEA_019985 [Camellia sinensis var. sinensis]